MLAEGLALREVKLVRTRRIGEPRGYSAETYNRRLSAETGTESDFVQDNESHSAKPGTLRGLHYQVPPHAQAKLVRVLRGRIYDVAVDIRRASPNYGRFVAAELDADRGDQIFIPYGFAHGFVTLEPDTVVFYKVDAFHAPAAERGIAWNDPAIGIDWPLQPGALTLSEKDRANPTLADAEVFD